MKLDCQELANDLATAVRKRYVEQVAFAGLPMAFKTNAGRIKYGSLHEDAFREMTEADIKPYQEALNRANQEVWNILHKAYKLGCIPKTPGKSPKVSYDPNKKCDGRCWSASGYECVCKCGGAFHGMGEDAVRMAMGI